MYVFLTLANISKFRHGVVMFRRDYFATLPVSRLYSTELGGDS
jgi:hypothetical protein